MPAGLDFGQLCRLLDNDRINSCSPSRSEQEKISGAEMTTQQLVGGEGGRRRI
jgi:hypothetical protein